MEGLFIFLGSIAFVVAVFTVIAVVRNKEVFFSTKNHLK